MAMKTKDTSGIDRVDPSTHPSRDAAHFRRIVSAREAIEKADADLRAAVREARQAGDSWATIGVALDMSKQAAWERFGKVE